MGSDAGAGSYTEDFGRCVVSRKASKEDMASHFEYIRQYIKGKVGSGEVFTILGDADRERAFSIGYTAATSDAKALVGELVAELESAYGFIDKYYESFGIEANKQALTKATAWLSNSPVKEG